MQIRTTLHRAIDCVKQRSFAALIHDSLEDAAVLPLMRQYYSKYPTAQLIPTLEGAAKLPLFVLSDTVYAMASEVIAKDCSGDIGLFRSMLDNSLFRLAYPNMVLEHSERTKNAGAVTTLTVFNEYATEESVSGFGYQAIVMDFSAGGKTGIDRVIPPYTVYDVKVTMTDDMPALAVKWTAPAIKLPAALEPDREAVDTKCIARSLLMSILVLSSRGFGREHISAGKLNKSRRSSGKTPVPDHTLIRLTHYTGKDGKEHVCDDTRRMPLHYRRGHVRNLAVGVGRQGRKPVWIEGCFVNYDPDNPKLPTYRVIQ